VANGALDDLVKELATNKNIFNVQLVREIEMYREKPENFKVQPAPTISDGNPIGSFSVLEINKNCNYEKFNASICYANHRSKSCTKRQESTRKSC
jgi:hypothetical protein